MPGIAITRVIPLVDSNIPYTINEHELFEFFAACGNILEVRLKAEKGIAFVVLGDSSAVVQALTMDGEELQGRRIKVKFDQIFFWGFHLRALKS